MKQKLRKEKSNTKNAQTVPYLHDVTYDSKGITLIALIITIVVLMILATVSLQAISGEGIFGKAREAAFKAEMAQLQEDLGLFVTEKQLANRGNFDVTTLNASINGAYYNTASGVEVQEGTIETVLPSISEKRSKQIEIIKGELLFASQDENEKKWAQELGIGINPWNIVDGVLMSSDTNLKLLSEDGVLALPTSITKVADGAFANVKGIKKVIIPGNVKTIGTKAFSGISTLEEVIIENGVETIGEWAFYNCRALMTVKMTDSVITLRDYVFYECRKLENITLSNNIKVLPNYCFAGNQKLKQIQLPVNLGMVGTYAFSHCINLNQIILPENVTSIGTLAFNSCTNLTQITIPEKVSKIGSGVFSGCTNLSTIEIDPNNQSYASQNGILFNSGKTEMIWISKASSAIQDGTLTIPTGVTKINSGLISGYENVTKIKIPASVNSLDMGFFTKTITSVEIDSNNKAYQIDNNGLLYNKEKDGSKKILYKYIGMQDTINIPEGIEVISKATFSLRTESITKIQLPHSLLTVEEQSFNGLSNLESIDFWENVNSIHPYFMARSNIKVTISVDNKNYKVENGAILSYDGTNLVSVIGSPSTYSIPNGVTSLGERCFHNCGALKEIIIPEGVTSIGKNAFLWCGNLKLVRIPSSIISIDSTAFESCNALSEIRINKPEGSVQGSPWGCVIGDRGIFWDG